MKKTKKGYGKKALSVSLSMALMLGGTAPVQAADLFSDQTAEESTSMELYPEENTAEESNTADFAADETENGAEDFSAGQEDQADEFSAGDEDSSKAAVAEVQSASHVISTAADLPTGGIAEGETYELAADITLTSGQQISSIAGTLLRISRLQIKFPERSRILELQEAAH